MRSSPRWGSSSIERGRAKEALPLLERARSIQERAFGKDALPTRETVELMGLAHFACGDRPRAIDELSSPEVLDRTGSSRLHARAKFALARALAETKTADGRRQALTLATEALEILKHQERRDFGTEKDVAAWLQRHDKRASR